ncbi:MAG: pitrilysin family protein, partial [Clostridia bacterium]
VKENTKIGEKYYHLKHKSGLNVFIVPKKHAVTFATFATKFGSADCQFYDNEGNLTTLPDGVAHFLEHKMFEQPNGKDAFELYAKYGGNANAYTNEEQTVYLFSATDKFYDNLKILLTHVTNPHFTVENVAKEQGIIGQEIKMYDDNPNWRVFFNMLDCLYVNHPIKRDIAGSVESISKITPELLYKCHKCFYNLNNMVLCIAGDVDNGKVLAILDKILKPSEPFIATLKQTDEPTTINKQSMSQELEVAIPLYSIGIKCAPCENNSTRIYAAMEIAVGIIFGKSGSFYNDCYEKGIFNHFSANFQTIRESIAFLEISGVANEPKAVYDAVLAEIEKRKVQGFTDEEFTRAKKVLYADTVCDYDSTDDIANTFISYYFSNDDMLEYPNVIASVDKKYAEDCFKNIINIDNACISVIKPKSKG